MCAFLLEGFGHAYVDFHMYLEREEPPTAELAQTHDILAKLETLTYLANGGKTIASTLITFYN